MTTLISESKISPPRLSGAVARPRLYSALDALYAEPQVRLVWLAGAPGSGKTTLAAGYLQHRRQPALWLRVDEADADPAAFFAHLGAAAVRAGLNGKATLPALTREHCADVPRFAHLYFRALFAAANGRGLLVVLDDLHTLGTAPVHERIQGVLAAEATDRVRLLLLSRAAMPESLARFVVNGTAREMPGGTLAFTLKETSALLRNRKRPAREAEALHASTRGWAAATALQANLGAAHYPAGAADGARRQMAAYLNAEVFAPLTDEVQRGFLAIAWLPVVRCGWAAALGASADTERRLETMAANGVLVHTYVAQTGTGKNRLAETSEREYQLHPLFGDFLRECARARLTGTEFKAAQLAAARLLDRAGIAEAAMPLILAAEAWHEACERIVDLAPALLVAARQETVIGWANAVPEERRSAWLKFWLGQAEMFGDPAAGREHVREAYEVFRNAADPAPRYRALAAIIATYFFEYSTMTPMSRWLAEFHTLGMEYDALADDNVKAVAAVGVWSGLFIREPQHADLPVWEARVHAMLKLAVDPNVKIRGAMLLGKHYWYTGQHPRIWPLAGLVRGELDKPGVLPYTRLVWHLLLQYDAWSRADAAGGRQAAEDALQVAEQNGIHLLDCHLRLHAAGFALAAGDGDAAAALEHAATEHNPARRMEAWHLYAYRSWQAVLAATPRKAIECAAIALDAAEAIGPPPLCVALVGMCYALHAAGDLRTFGGPLEQLKQLAAATGNGWATFHGHLLDARLAQARNETALCHTRIGAAFRIGRENHLYHFLFAEPKVLASLCAEALTAGIEAAYARELIGKQRLVPPEAPRLRDAWPWPVRIYTLGRFSLVIDDRPLVFNGKAQKKTLELLKAVVALGGREVDAGELADVLWPDAQGDAARSALDMSLHRLRKLLGCEEAIVMRDGKVSLNPDLCWVDVWAFERGLGRLAADRHDAAQESAGNGDANGHAVLKDKVLALYQGAFLGSEPEHPWLLPTRERLRQRYLRAVLALGRDAESLGQWDEAAAAYERGLEQDSLAEELYRRLMICHLQRRDHAATVSTYRRCRDLLSVVLGVRPSSQTEAVYRSLPRPDLSRHDPMLQDLAPREIQ